MKYVSRDRNLLKYAVDFRHAPVLEVEAGESFTLDTEDAPSGSCRSLGDGQKLLDAWYLNYSSPMSFARFLRLTSTPFSANFPWRQRQAIPIVSRGER